MLLRDLGRFAASALALLICGGWFNPPASPAAGRSVTPGCRRLVAHDGAANAQRIDWRLPTLPDDRHALDEWCAAVGPAIAINAPVDLARRIDMRNVILATWNAHVGGGDVPAFVAALRRGDFTGGTRVEHFVLLIQEAFRAGADVPAKADSETSAGRIEEFPPSGTRRDIVSVARDLGLSVYYVPSMRNGTTGLVPEDRGNAIVSTLPLDSFAALELPFERQRRVAIAAAISGVDGRGVPWHARVASAHLDATASAKRLRLFAAGVRARQARALAAEFNDGAESSVMGTDLNTWWGGAREPAYKTLLARFPATPPVESTGRVLDYLLFRLPVPWRGEAHRLKDRFGSDHSPIVGMLRN